MKIDRICPLYERQAQSALGWFALSTKETWGKGSKT